ncbi:uncharacterized protein LOC115442695 [Manduca sexta]|uniref:Protein sleepless n=1 Tax=Manduca sexta TaxID=7130 RepID=A0A921Z161_MANSE|nr:uncharacterized protein LOC115442695 [Manduca sexta]KAG6448875.1 hypothetical protein O3G_MSEX005748 [Manduca sexta]
MAKSVAITLAFLLAVFEIGSCLRCYQCNSQEDPACADPYKSAKAPVDCASQDSINYNQLYLRNMLPPEVFGTVAGAPRYCHKIVTQTGTTVRTCLDANPADINHTCRLIENSSKMASVESKKIKHCSVCDKDNCNGSGTVSLSAPLAALALVASYLYYKQ